MSFRLLGSLVVLFLFSEAVLAQFSQPGELDTTFNFGRPHSFFSSLANPLPGEGAIGIIQVIVRQPDGKVLIGGDFTSYNGTPRNRITRLNADGSLDATFNSAGTGADSAIHFLVRQPDGKVLIGGNFINYNGTLRNRIARLNADGSLDASFNPGTGANDLVNSLVLQQNGKLLIGGDFTTYNGAPRNRIARLNADGSLDASFNPGSGADGTVRSLALQPDAKVLIGGMFTSYNDTPRRRIARLNADGSLDSTFNPAGTGANNLVSSLALQPDRKVLIGGWFSSYNGTSRNFIARLNADGSLDASFNPSTGVQGGQLPIVQSLALQPDGKVLIGGFFSIFAEPSNNHIVRLNANGTLDASFNPGTGLEGGLLPSVESLALLPDGKVLIGGEFISYNGTPRNGIARLNADGRLDSTFNPSTGVDNGVESLALQSDGKVLIGGSFSSYNGTPRSNIARLNADGSIDATFNPGTGANDMVNSLAFQPDGKVLIGGMFTNYNNTPRRRIARLNADGSLDVSFNPGTGANDEVYSFALQPDRKVLIGGMFTNYNDTSRRRIARLNADGSLDASFNPGTGVQGGPFPIVESLVLQPDGKVLVGGFFSTYNGISRNNIARLNANGSLDATFNLGTGPNSWLYTLALQPDGKMLIGGLFTSYNGTPRNHIARLNADGSLDADFNPGTGANRSVESLAVQPDGKILIGGSFTTYNGTPRNGIARLNANGSLDATFNPGTGANDLVRSLSLQPDGKVLIGGDFTNYNGISRSRIARVFSPVDGVFYPIDCAKVPKVSWTGEVSSDWHTAGNWSTGNVPTGAMHVIIGPAANICVIGAANAEAYSVQVRNGGRLEQRNGYKLTLLGTCTQLPPP